MTTQRRGRSGRGWDAAAPRVQRSGRGAQSPSGANAKPSGRGRDSTRHSAAGHGGDPEDPTGGSADQAERAREICLRLLAVRPRTRSELATALRQRGIDDAVAEEVLARYGEVGMIDDQAFARAWVSSRHHGRGLARRALASELRQKGVDSETVGRALDELDPDTEKVTARALVDRKLRTERPITASTPLERRVAVEALLRRLVGMLARKGYGPGFAIGVVREALHEWPGARQPTDAQDDDALAGADLDLVAEALESEARAADD